MVTSTDEFDTLGYRRAMLVTPNKALPGILTAMLAPVGFEIELISMTEARQLNPEDFTILILDGEPDFEFTRFPPGVVVISPTNAAQMYDRGADVVIERPLAGNILVAKIRAMLRRYDIHI